MTGALLASMAIALLIGPKLISELKKLHFGQTIYELGPSHQSKQGTPVMGGLMMAAGILVSSLAFHPAEWNGGLDVVIPLLLVAFLSMAVGFADDYIKAVKKRHDGLNPWQKIAGQVIVAVGFSIYCYFHPEIGSRIRVPFTGRLKKSFPPRKARNNKKTGKTNSLLHPAGDECIIPSWFRRT